jgi:pimeloyl-ACP methyl ester carboxylesterase
MSSNIAESAQTRWLERPEGRIAYDAIGTGPLVVCVPGMSELRSVYRHTAPALAAAGYQVVTMDLRGHGDSDATFASYDDVAAGGDLLALIEQLGGPATVIGNSMGAGAAAWAAAERPQLVSGLVLVGAFVRNPPLNPLVALASAP